MNKNLLQETERIKKLMNLSLQQIKKEEKKILSEQMTLLKGIIKKGMQNLDDFIEKGLKDEIDDATKMIKADDYANKIRRATNDAELDNILTKMANDIDDYKFIGQIRSLIGQGATEMETKIINSIDEHLKTSLKINEQSIDNLANLYKKYISKYSFIDDETAEILSKNFKESLEQRYNTKIVGKVDDDIQKALTNDVKPKVDDVKPKVDDTTTNKTGTGTAIENVDYKTLEISKSMTWLDSFLASNITFFNVVRRAAVEFFEARELKKIGTSKYVEEIFSKIKGTIQDVSDNVANYDTDTVKTKLRQISIELKQLQKENNLSQIYDAIEEKLESEFKNEPKELDKVKEFMKNLRTVDPYKVDGKWSDKSWVLRWYKDTATSKYMSEITDFVINFFRTIFRKGGAGRQMLENFKNIMDRTFHMLWSGSPKSTSELRLYIRNNPNTIKALRQFMWHLWWGTHIGFPIMAAVGSLIWNLFKLLSGLFGGGEENIGWWEDFKGALTESFTGTYKWSGLAELVTGGYVREGETTPLSIIYGLATPGHAVIFPMWSWVSEVLDMIERGETDVQKYRKYMKNCIKKGVAKECTDTAETMWDAKASFEEIEKAVIQCMQDKGINDSNSSSENSSQEITSGYKKTNEDFKKYLESCKVSGDEYTGYTLVEDLNSDGKGKAKSNGDGSIIKFKWNNLNGEGVFEIEGIEE